jgi:hypothetical protein
VIGGIRLKRYEARYHTPLGLRTVLFGAEDIEEARRIAEHHCRFGLIEPVWIKSVDDPEAVVQPAMYGELTDWS